MQMNPIRRKGGSAWENSVLRSSRPEINLEFGLVQEVAASLFTRPHATLPGGTFLSPQITVCLRTDQRAQKPCVSSAMGIVYAIYDIKTTRNRYAIAAVILLAGIGFYLRLAGLQAPVTRPTSLDHPDTYVGSCQR